MCALAPAPNTRSSAPSAAGETVDVGDCTGSWCRVSFSGGTGFANRSYLAMGGGGPAVAVARYAVAPGYAYSEPYDDDYYDYGYAYGPSVGFGVYASPGYRYRHGWRGRHWQGGGNWAGRPGGGNWAGRPGGGNWAGRPGVAAIDGPGGRAASTRASGRAA